MGLSDKITTLACSMDNLPFKDEEYDVIWSEGAIYNIGFEKGVKDWNRYLKVGGLMVVSEITWLTVPRPSELQKHWEGAYPEINVASSKLGILEKTAILRLVILFCRNIAGWIIIIDLCRIDLRISLAKTEIAKKRAQ